MRTTIADVAREAGVSTATVDRVLNGRVGVKSRTREKVMGAAARLGYVDGPPAPGPDAPCRLDILLPGGTNSFMGMLAGHVEEQAAARATDADIRLHRIEGFNPDALAAALDEIGEASDGIAVIALDHPTVREAIRRLARAGKPVMTLVSDISQVPRIGYVGIDNRAAGRLAGHLLGRFMGPGRGKVALLAGSLSYRGHEEREMGFRHILAEEFPALEVVELREVRDDTDRAYGETRALLDRHADLGGIYNIGAGNRGIARALDEAGRSRDVVFIGHELTEHTRRFLLSGVMDAVIDQNPRVEAREAIERLLQAWRGTPAPAAPAIRVQAIFRENIPET